MEKLRARLQTKTEKTIAGGSVVGLILKTYETRNNPVLIKMRDAAGDYTRIYRASDILSKGYHFSQMLKSIHGHHVGYISDNHIDIVGVDVGTWINHNYTVGFYKTDPIEDLNFKIKDSEIDVMVVNQEGWDKISQLPGETKAIFKKIFLLEGTPLPPDQNGFAAVETLKLEADESKVALVNYDDPEKVARNIVMLLYTSGSTGKPKGVPQTNKNILESCFSFIRCIFGPSSATKSTAYFLPNAHVFQRSVYVLGFTGAFVGYITTRETFMEDMPKISPQFMFGVPLLYQKIANQIEHKLINMTRGYLKEKDFICPTMKNRLLIRPVLAKLVKKKLGFSNLEFILSGGASLNNKTFDFYEHTIGIKISGGYGSSESCSSGTASRYGRRGAAGQVALVNQVDIRNRNEDGSGEIWLKGENIFSGYLNANEQDCFDQDGFFCTGDLGYFDEDGFLYVKGRTKNYHKAADGRFYNTDTIAEKVLSKLSSIQQVAIHVLDADFPIALVTLGEDFIDFPSYQNDEQLISKIKEECKRMVEKMQKEGYHPIPQKFVFTPAYTETNGMLTPTKKIKVNKVLDCYEVAINSLRQRQDCDFIICDLQQEITYT